MTSSVSVIPSLRCLPYLCVGAVDRWQHCGRSRTGYDSISEDRAAKDMAAAEVCRYLDTMTGATVEDYLFM